MLHANHKNNIMKDFVDNVFVGPSKMYVSLSMKTCLF